VRDIMAGPAFTVWELLGGWGLGVQPWQQLACLPAPAVREAGRDDVSCHDPDHRAGIGSH